MHRHFQTAKFCDLLKGMSRSYRQIAALTGKAGDGGLQAFLASDLMPAPWDEMQVRRCGGFAHPA